MTRRLFGRIAVALLALGLVSACSSRGPKKLAAPPAGDGSIKVTRAWSMPLGSSAVGFAAIFVRDSVWAAARGGTVVKVDAETGRVRWRIELRESLVSGIGSDGSLSVVGTESGDLIGLDDSGQIKWRYPMGSRAATVPAIGLGLVIVRAGDGRIIAVDAESGQRRWVQARQNPSLLLRQLNAVAIAPDAAYVGLPAGRLASFALNTGVPRWEIPFAVPKGQTELERITDLVGQPLIIGRDVCAVAFQGKVGCVDAVSGNPVWSRDLSSSTGIDVDVRFLFAADEKGELTAFTRTGAQAWKSDKLLERDLSAPLATPRSVVVGDRAGFVHWLARDSGALQTSIETDASAIVAAPIAAGARVVVLTQRGSLIAFDAQ